MRPVNSSVVAIGGFLAVLISSSAVFAQDPLTDAIRRIGYWHLHIKQTTINNGTATVERDYDQCLDLRNPAPPVSRLAQWACPEFNTQKTPTALHTRAVCTFINNGQLTGRTDVELGRDGSTATYRQDVSASWTNPNGSQAQSHTISFGRLTGDCPAGATVIANHASTISAAEDAIIRHNR